MNLEWLGYVGVFFAAIYRIPQVVKLYRTKKGADVSKKSFMLHNGAYISLILYISLSKPETDYILLGYYVTGLVQNILIILMKQYYKVYGKTEPEPSGGRSLVEIPGFENEKHVLTPKKGTH